MTDHSSHTHPQTSAGRAACRKASQANPEFVARMTPALGEQAEEGTFDKKGWIRKGASLSDEHMAGRHPSSAPVDDCILCAPAREVPATRGRVYANDREETEPCERLTPGCSINHNQDSGECATW